VADNIALKASSLQANIEKVRDKLQDYFESSDQISGLIGKGGEVETISQKLYRIPVRLFRGGSYQKFNADAGDMGSGSGMKIDKLTAGYIYSDYVVEVSQEAMDTTSKPGQAVVNVFAKQLSEAMDEMKVYDDIAFHGDGSGKLTNSGSAYGSSGWSGGDTMTFAAATDYLGVGKLREGMVVSVFDTLGTTKRVTSVIPLQIDHIDYTNKVVYFNGTITAGANTDILTFANLTSDTAMQSFQSTWPLSGDTFRHGMYYANDATTTNYYLGQLKSTMTQLLPTRINASSSLVFQHGLLMLDGIVQRRDSSVVKGLVGIAHMSQRAAVHGLGIAISNWFRGASDKMIDVMPSNIGYEETFEFCGIKSHLSKRQDRSRFDFINPKVWGRAQLHDTKFHEVGGKTVFESRTSSGTLKAAQHFIITQAYDFCCYDPGAQGYCDNLTLPAGY
jgi:hypothetical protein